MANIYDQFDNAPAEPAVAKPSANIYDMFDKSEDVTGYGPSTKPKTFSEKINPAITSEVAEDRFNAVLDEIGGKEKIKRVAKQEAIGIKQGVTDPYYGGKQLGAHALASAETAQAVDKEVAEREKKYQEETPEASGTGRAAGNLITSLMGGASTVPVAVAKGAATAALTPVTNTEEESFGEQKAKQIGIGATLGAVPQTLQKGTRWALRGAGDVKGAQLAQNLNTFKRAGVTPRLGQVSEGGLTKGSGAPEAVREEQTAQLVGKASKELDKLSNVRTQAEAGSTIDEGLRNPGGYLERTKAQTTKLYEAAEAALPPTTPVKITNTLKAFQEVTALRPKMVETSATFIDPKIENRYATLVADAGKGQKLPYEDVKWLRSQIGEQISNPLQQAPGTSVRNLKTLYAGLSQDMEEAALAKGPKAYRLMKTANDFTKASHEKLETYYQPLIDKKVPQSIYKAMFSNSKDGADYIRPIMDALEPMQQDAVRAAYLNNEVLAHGPAEFFTNWNKMHPDVKEALFGKQGAALRTTLDRMSQVAGVAAKKGGTLTDMRSFVMNHAGEGEVAALAYLTHHYGLANVLIGTAGIGFLAGRTKLLSNPTFMNWLTKSSTKAPGTLISSLNQLQAAKKDMSDADQAEVDAYIENMRGLASVSKEAPKKVKPAENEYDMSEYGGLP